jgi:hypothetical protein
MPASKPDATIAASTHDKAIDRVTDTYWSRIDLDFQPIPSLHTIVRQIYKKCYGKTHFLMRKRCNDINDVGASTYFGDA